MNPRISIIVPVYNTAKYLHRCLDSILQQSFEDFEVLLVDDGSTDGSGKICDEYIAKDSRVRVFHKDNGGVSSARNVGLDNAVGEWVTFIDSDDELNIEGLRLDYEQLPNVDLILTAYYRKIGTTYELNVVEREENHDFKTFLSENLNCGIFSVVWGKFFKKEKIGNLRFDVAMKIGEDTLFTLMFLNVINECKVVNTVTYIYNQPQNLQKKYSLSVTDATSNLDKIHTAYKQLNIISIDFEKRIFIDYKFLCQEDIYAHVNEWYKDKRVLYMYNRIKSSMTLKYRFNYFLMSHPFFSALCRMIRNK
ncbi:glycosyltransferase family 2 protein [Phocaeicola coprophilus]|nr:glycosyltransferase family 2 protein [Phocaeicola coprophilus]